MAGGRCIRALGLVMGVCAFSAAGPAAAMSPISGCTHYAAPGGSDANPGTLRAPFRTAQKLATAILPGETGCLAGGTYTGGMAFRNGGGTAFARKVVQSVPGERALVIGQIYVPDGANFVTVRNLLLDGTNKRGKPSPMVNGDDAEFIGNDVTSAVESCFVLGDVSWGIAERTRIVGNHIHHCGVDGTNKDHGIYVRHAIGTEIAGNVIRENPDRGVQLYPNADGTTVRGNVIDANGVGVIFSGDDVYASDGNVVEDNLITYSDRRHDVEHFWAPGTGLVGTGNVLRRNCVFGGARGPILMPTAGYTAASNVLANPRYRVRDGADYELEPGSPCPVKPPAPPAGAS